LFAHFIVLIYKGIKFNKFYALSIKFKGKIQLKINFLLIDFYLIKNLEI